MTPLVNGFRWWMSSLGNVPFLGSSVKWNIIISEQKKKEYEIEIEKGIYFKGCSPHFKQNSSTSNNNV